MLRFLSHFDVGGFSHELLDIHGIHAVVSALVDHFQHIVLTNKRQRNLQSARPPASTNRHFARGKGDLMARNGNALDNGAANLALRSLVEKGEIIKLTHYCSSPFTVERTLESFDWKVT